MKYTPGLLWFSLFLLLIAGSCTSQSVPPVTRVSPTGAISIPATTDSPVPRSTIPSISTVPSTPEPANTFFDDFQYDSQEDMTSHGWIIRGQAGWPGVPGAVFRPENVSFLDDADLPGNRLQRMTSSTDGNGASTFQTQICHQRKYLDGTYAVRVYFNNEPASGPDGDQVVETFYAITPYEEPLKPEYSEMDFEYLPNGGWGLPPMTFAFTTWETVQIEPWLADNASASQVENSQGWRTLVLQVKDGTVRYFVSGELVAEHTGNYYPDSPVSINFNLWFIDGGLTGSSEERSYREDIDWVYHEAGVILTPQQVNKKVRELRQAGTGFVDTVLAPSPTLESPCDL